MLDSYDNHHRYRLHRLHPPEHARQSLCPGCTMGNGGGGVCNRIIMKAKDFIDILEDVLEDEYVKRNPPNQDNFLDTFRRDVHREVIKRIGDRETLQNETRKTTLSQWFLAA